MSDNIVEVEFTHSQTKRYRISDLTSTCFKLADGCMHLFYKNGSDPIKHVVSIPLHNIRQWRIWDA